MTLTAVLAALLLPCLHALTPSLIDPMDPNAGDFLDTDLQQYLTSARDAYTEGNYKVAIRYYLAALSHNIDDEISIYNVACCYALMEEVELTSLYLQRAVLAGYRDVDFIREDPDFDLVRDDPLFTETMRHIAAALGESPEYQGEVLMFQGEALFRCLIMLPEDYDPYREYPLVVGLHGYGDSPEYFIQLWSRFYRPDFIYACPRGPYSYTENNTSFYSWFPVNNAEHLTPDADTASAEYVVSLVHRIKDEYLVSEVFLFGFSQGCGLTWLTGLYYPEEFDGLIGFGGSLDTAFVNSDLIGDVSDLRAFVASGTLDDSAGPEQGEAAADYLRGLGIETVFRTWEGYHMVSRDMLRQAQQWMGTFSGI